MIASEQTVRDRLMARRYSLSCTLPVDLVEAIEVHRVRLHGVSRSQAVEDLLVLGLEQVLADEREGR